ncbi:unnamed protein product [Cunninghamella blakesleeana]
MMKGYLFLLHIFLLIPTIYSQVNPILSKNISITSPETNITYQFKQPTFCDSVTQYSGYIEVNPTTHYFFWFFESKENPETAPVTLWLNGGPGCSSLSGIFKGVGPCTVINDNTKDGYDERGAWNRKSNLLFIDQPAGTGFSYGNLASSTDESTVLAYSFLLKFFDAFPKYRKNPLHIFGESYAGHFIPSMADYILKENQKLTSENQYKKFNLQTIGIGNSLINMKVQYQYAQKMACDSTYGSVLSKPDCDLMLKNTPNCIQRLEACKTTLSVQDCVSATKYCSNYIDKIYRRSGRRYYDVRSTNITVTTNYFKFVTQGHIKESLGVPSNHPFHMCNSNVKRAFYDTGDYAKDFSPYLSNILNQDIRVLLYAGDADYRGNWYGNLALSQQLNFKNSFIYQSNPLQPWKNQQGVEIGQYQSGGGLTFVRVYNAGHKVHSDKPEVSYEMFLKHLDNSFR